MEKYPQLFNTEDKSLELRLGPPGEDQSQSLLFLGCSNNNNNNSSHGAKRVFQEIMMSVAAGKAAENCSKSCGVTKVQQHSDKKACSGLDDTANTTITNSSSKSTAAIAPVVGWPPIGSFRKNVASKPAPNSPNETPKEGSDGKSLSFKNNQLFIKISMEGIPIGRKINLSVYDSYEELSFAIDELFKDLLAAQRDPSGDGNENNKEQSKELSGSLAKCDEYTLVYEDNEGDRILVGDVPWHMFVSTVKKLLVLKTSELLINSMSKRRPHT
ncbi:hypothetical protein Dsin_017725 [Dipteronia sinensis]|uniref:Auxin-responsive protein n=1 Tax=Dipteronia sinensis TaxID=43782 RepID=A0AAE0E6U0_9ROSI|nr:hypothetical protein Dsin_017725 [Dipteronia sinensis]